MIQIPFAAIAAICLFFAFVCGELARQKNRRTILWAVLGFFFSFISLFILVITEPNPKSKTENEETKPSNENPNGNTPDVNYDISAEYKNTDAKKYGNENMLILKAQKEKELDEIKAENTYAVVFIIFILLILIGVSVLYYY